MKDISPWFSRPTPLAGKRIAIIGAGLAGLMTAYSLKKAGFAIELFDAAPSLPNPQCTNPAMLLRPYRSPDNNFFDQLYTPGFLGMLEFIQTQVPEALIHVEPELAVVSPLILSQFLLQGQKVHLSERVDHTELKSKFDAVVIATGAYANLTEPLSGQASIMKGSSLPLIYEGGYCIPDGKGQLLFGATFRHDGSLEVREADHQYNLAQLEGACPALGKGPFSAFVGMRYTTRDHLPLIGGLPMKAKWLKDYDRLRFGDRRPHYPNCPYQPGIYLNIAHGSKGLSSSFMGSRTLTALLTGAPLPIGMKLWEALHPARFWLRTLKCGNRASLISSL